MNHKAEAEGRLGILNDNEYTGSTDEALTAATMAQVSATLYLAEQQRIANLITWLGDGEASTNPTKRAAEIAVMRQIVEGLGLA